MFSFKAFPNWCCFFPRNTPSCQPQAAQTFYVHLEDTSWVGCYRPIKENNKMSKAEKTTDTIISVVVQSSLLDYDEDRKRQNQIKLLNKIQHLFFQHSVLYEVTRSSCKYLDHGRSTGYCQQSTLLNFNQWLNKSESLLIMIWL